MPKSKGKNIGKLTFYFIRSKNLFFQLNVLLWTEMVMMVSSTLSAWSAFFSWRNTYLVFSCHLYVQKICSLPQKGKNLKDFQCTVLKERCWTGKKVEVMCHFKGNKIQIVKFELLIIGCPRNHQERPAVCRRNPIPEDVLVLSWIQCLGAPCWGGVRPALEHTEKMDFTTKKKCCGEAFPSQCPDGSPNLQTRGWQQHSSKDNVEPVALAFPTSQQKACGGWPHAEHRGKWGERPSRVVTHTSEQQMGAHTGLKGCRSQLQSSVADGSVMNLNSMIWK